MVLQFIGEMMMLRAESLMHENKGVTLADSNPAGCTQRDVKNEDCSG
jgi:hypothetical protein